MFEQLFELIIVVTVVAWLSNRDPKRFNQQIQQQVHDWNVRRRQGRNNTSTLRADKNIALLIALLGVIGAVLAILFLFSRMLILALLPGFFIARWAYNNWKEAHEAAESINRERDEKIIPSPAVTTTRVDFSKHGLDKPSDSTATVAVEERVGAPLISSLVPRIRPKITTTWVWNFARRLFGTAVLLLSLSAVCSEIANGMGVSVVDSLLVYFAAAIVSYFRLRSFWLWDPVALTRKLAVLLSGAVIVAGGWYYLDSVPLTSFGRVQYSGGGGFGYPCSFSQRASWTTWEHGFTLPSSESGTCPYTEVVTYLTTKDGQEVLDKNGEPIVLNRRMVDRRQAVTLLSPRPSPTPSTGATTPALPTPVAPSQPAAAAPDSSATSPVSDTAACPPGTHHPDPEVNAEENRIEYALVCATQFPIPPTETATSPDDCEKGWELESIGHGYDTCWKPIPQRVPASPAVYPTDTHPPDLSGIFRGLRPSTVISRCGRPIEDKVETRSQPFRMIVRTLVYSTRRYGQVDAQFVTLSPTLAPTPTVDIPFLGLLIRTAGGSQSLGAKPDDRKLIIDILPCLVPDASDQSREQK